MSEVQSVIFNRNYYTIKEARQKLKQLGFPLKKEHVTDTQIRYRQYAPIFKHYRTKKISKGISLVIGFT